MVERLVMYRASSLSGVLAAWALRMAYPGPETLFKSDDAPANATPSVRSLPPSCEIVFVETCPRDADWLVACCSAFRRVVLWDHHEEALQLLESCLNLPRNLHMRVHRYMSGCMLACRDLGVQFTARQRALFALVQDYELGIHLHPHSHAFWLALKAQQIEGHIERNPDLFAQLANLDPDHLVAEGLWLQALEWETQPELTLLWDSGGDGDVTSGSPGIK